jgi:hypothetical protein
MSDVIEQGVGSKVDEEYNGWSNYETWLVALWLNNDQESYGLLQEICSAQVSDYRKGERIEELIRELYLGDEVGMTADLVNAAIGRVDFVEIARAAKE